MANDQTVTLEGRYVDGITPGLRQNVEAMRETTTAVNAMERAEQVWQNRINDVRASIRENVGELRARAEALKDPATMRAVDETRRLREEIDGLTRAAHGEREIMRDMNVALADNLTKLEAQRKVLSDPGYVAAMREERKLKAEINELTKAATGIAHAETEELKLSARQRRELIVIAHEAFMLQPKSVISSGIVLQEGQGGASAAFTAAAHAMGGPMVVGAVAAGAAVAAVGFALWEASKAAAENYHHLNQLGKSLGVSGQTMLGFQQMTVGTTVTAEEMARGFARFTVKLGENRDELQKAGITAREPIDAFTQLMDVAKNTADPIARNTLLNKALGEEWQRLAPVILQGGDAAKAAIEQMKIPENILHNYERASEAQIEIDKNWKLIAQHAGEAASGPRAYFLEIEAGLSRIASKEGLFAGGSTLARILGGLATGNIFSLGAGLGEALARDPNASGPKPYSEDFSYTKAQEESLAAAKKERAKTNVHEAVDLVREEWKKKADAFQVGSTEYVQVMRAGMAAEDAVRESFKKKHKTKKGKAENDGFADDAFERATGISYGAYSVVHPEGVEADDGVSRSRTKSMVKSDQDAAKAAEKAEQDAAKLNNKKQLSELQAFAKLEKSKTDILRAELKHREQDFDHYSKVVTGFANKEVSAALQGELTITQFKKDAKDQAISFAVEEATAWVESTIRKAFVSKAQKAVEIEEGIAAQAAIVAASAATAAAVGAEWAGPAALAIAATGGTTAVTGQAAFTALLAETRLAAIPMRERGGFAFGDTIFGERGPERSTPIVPSQITNHYYTTNSRTNGPQHIHFHGADLKTIKRIIRNADADGEDTSR